MPRCLTLILACALALPATTEPVPHATGHLHLTFTDPHPLSNVDLLLDRLGLSDPANHGNDKTLFQYDLPTQSFQAVVSPAYKPTTPHGLLVWMGTTQFDPQWLPILARHKLIFIDANFQAGRADVYAKSLDVVHNMKKLYNLDPRRIYASGFSGGGVTATYMVQAFREVFSGGYFLVWGGGFYRLHQNQNKRWEVMIDYSRKWHAPLEQLKKDTKLVILKGEREGAGYTAQQGRANHEALLHDGFTRVSYLEVPGLAHNHPSPAWFERGIIALEAKPKTPPTTSPTTNPNPTPAQIAVARRILVTGLYHHQFKPPNRPRHIQESMIRGHREKSRKYLQRVLDEYPTTPSAAKARELLKTLDPPAAAPAQKPP